MPVLARQPRIKSLTFRVGSRDYNVILSKTPVFFEGEKVQGCSDQEANTITISPEVLVQNRLRVLIFELARVWTWEVGRPGDSDEWYQFVATVAASAMRDLLPVKSWKKFDPLRA